MIINRVDTTEERDGAVQKGVLRDEVVGAVGVEASRRVMR